MPGNALEHLRVVEYGSGVAAPFCARLFADFGAEVVKVEPPAGDPLRDWGPFPAGGSGPEQSGLFHFLNAGKHGARADLDDPRDREWLLDLLGSADVFVESTEADQRARWGFGFDSLLARHPRLVVVSISPYGRSGPWAERPGTDLTASALSALPVGLGDPAREPLRIPWEQADYQAGLHAAAAALCAVYERRASGRGQGIDIATTQVIGYQAGGMHLVTAKQGRPWRRRGGRLMGFVYPSGLFECRDGMLCLASQTKREWLKFLELMGEPDWARDEALRDGVRLARSGFEAVDSHFRAWLAQYSRQELLEMTMQAGIILGVVNDVPDLLVSAQFAAREAWAELDLDGIPVRVPKPGYRMGETPIRIGARGPRLEGERASLPPAPRARGAESAGRPRRAALEGVRILDFTWNWAGPMASQLLADMGAEVIRVETAKRQDMMRFLDYTSFFFCHNNRSKKSVAIDVRNPEGAALVRELARRVDVVMDNFSAGVMARNGLGYQDLRRVKADIICVSMSMAGQHGPLRAMRGFASVATAYSGLETMVGYDGEPTGLLPFGLGDTTQAVQGALAALAALHHRDRTGEGQFVDMSQLESATATMGEPILAFQLTGKRAAPQGNAHGTLHPHGILACAGEDRWVAIAVRDASDWRALARLLGRPDWAEDEALASHAGRRSRAAEIEAALRAWCRARDRDEAADVLCAAGVPAAPALEMEERDRHPHFVARGHVLEHTGGPFDPCRIYATPWLLTATPPALRSPTPGLGEHDDYVLRELIGLDGEAIRRLRDAGVLG